MSLLKVLLVALVVALVQADDCLDKSYAPGAVNKVTALAPATFSGLTTGAAINTALKAIYDITIALSSPFVQNVYVGASNGDFYMVKNCATQEGPNDYCTSVSQYLVYVRNEAFFGDAFRHIYNVASTGAIDVTVGAGAVLNVAYNPAERFWFTAPGWSSLVSYASGGQGKTFSKAFGTGLVSGADKSLFEYCGACLSSSYAVPVTQALAIADFSSSRAITAASGFSAVATILLKALNDVASPFSLNAIIGLPNGDSYMVKVCENSVGTAGCSNNKYLFYVTNQAVYGDSVRRVFVLSDAGVVGAAAGDVGAYNVTGRQWYTTLNGWSETYTFATSSGEGRTYVLGINGGVVGTDRTSSEPCSRAESENCVTSGSTVVAASVVLAVLAFVASVF